MAEYSQISPEVPASSSSSKAVLFPDEIADNARILADAKARSAQARAELLAELPSQTPRARRANRYDAKAKAEALHEDGPVASIVKRNKEDALAELAQELSASPTPEELDAESLDYDDLQAKYDSKAFQLDRAHTSRRPNKERIEQLGAELEALRVQLMPEAA